MKITYLNGSPQGDNSVTLQYLLYLKKKFPNHTYTVWNVAQKINSIEKNPEKFEEIIADIRNADGVIWGFPLYVFLLPSQYKRFIELVFERGSEVQAAFKNKYTVALSTSIHFFDHTCHKYLHAVCDDLNMKFLGYYSADTWDLLIRKKRPQFLSFGERFFDAIEQHAPTTQSYSPLIYRKFSYILGIVSEKIELKGKHLLVIADLIPPQSNLANMIQRFRDSFASQIQIFTFKEINLIYPCLGCMKCGYDNTCVHCKKDGFNDFWKSTLIKADIIVFAGEMKDRYLSSDWKKFFDRGYFMNHTPSFSGKQIGFIISGPLNQNHNLKETLQAFTEFQQANNVGFVTDEFGESSDIDQRIQYFAQQSIWNAQREYIAPPTFLGISSQKIFRDDVYGRLRFVCQADHRNYKKNGYYATFPQKDKFSMKLNRKMMFISRFKKGRKRLYDELIVGLVKPFLRVVADPNR